LELPALLKMDGVVITFQKWSPREQYSWTFLAPSERDRVAKLRSSSSRAEFIAGRTALHHAGLALGHDVSGSRINYDRTSGKPYFDPTKASFNFSIAHTLGLACCVASLDHQVGCDCERWDRPIRTEALSFFFRRSFASERESLIEWTKLEAFLKLRGRRLIDTVDEKGRLVSPGSEELNEKHISHVTLDLNKKFVVSYCTDVN